MLTSALDFMVVMIGCALNERMLRKLDYTQREVRVLKEVVEALTGTSRMPLTNAQRRGLAINRYQRPAGQWRDSVQAPSRWAAQPT